MAYGLPPDLDDFTGRARAVADLTAALTPGASVPVAAVGGMAGVGKTALALHVAHAMRRSYPGGRLYADLCGTAGRPREPRAVLADLLRALGRADIPAGLEERAALYRSELAGRRVLVILDEARDRAQVRPLLPGAPGSAVLVTSRGTMAGLPGARLVDLDVLEPAEALALLERVAGADRVAAERGAALDLVAACGFLPLAVRVAGSRLATRPSLGVGDLARRLAGDRLGELPAVDACLRRGRTGLGPEQARAFRLLALTDGPGFSVDAAAAVLGVDRARADDIVDSLADRCLLECVAPGRYRYHDLLRLFALREAEKDESPGARSAAVGRLVELHLAAARDAQRALDLGEPEGVAATARAAGTWLFTEHRAVFAAVGRAAAEPDGPLASAADLLLAMTEFLDHGWNPRELEAAARTVRDAARRRDAPGPWARAECVIGLVRWWCRDRTECDRALHAAVDLGTRHGDHHVAGVALDTLAAAALTSGRLAEADALNRRAEESWRAFGDRRAEARSYVTRARLQLRRDTPTVAVVSCMRGLNAFLESGDADGASYALYNLGVALTEAGRTEEALARYTESLAFSRMVGARLREAHTLTHLASANLDRGRPREAVRRAEQALDVFGGGPEVDRGHALAVLGRGLEATGDHAGAQARLTEACAVLAGEDGPALRDVRAHLWRLHPRD